MERLRQKIAKTRYYLELIHALKQGCLEKIPADVIYRGALLHYLYLLADSCIVIAELVIRIKGLRPPQSYAESFDILGENGILPPDFAYDFAKIAGFRNFLAHDYEGVDPEYICEKILAKLTDVTQYLLFIETGLEKPPQPSIPPTEPSDL